MKQTTWTHTKPNTQERDAAIITDAANRAIYYKETGRCPIDHDVALRTLITLKLS